MKTVSVVCHECGALTDKPQKEVNRKNKKGKSVFFCGIECFRKHQQKNYSQSWEATHNRARYVFLKLNRYRRVCFICQKTITGKFHVHHIDNDFANNSPSNLSPVHPTCHNNYHNGENYKTRKNVALNSISHTSSLDLLKLK